jgi:hypothetical protein
VDGATIYTEEIEPGIRLYVSAYQLHGLKLLWRQPLGNLNVSVGSLLALAGGVLVVASQGSRLVFHFFGPAGPPWKMAIPNSTIGALSDTGGELIGMVPIAGDIVLATVDGGLFAFSRR